MATANEYLNLSGIIATLRSRIWFVLSCVLVSGVAFGAYALLAAPVYRATTILVPAQSGRNAASGTLAAFAGSLGGLADLAGLSGGIDPSTNEAVAVLKSRSFTEDFIELYDLTHVLLGPSKRRSGRPVSRAARLLDKKVRTVTMDGKTGLVMVHMDWSDPVAAANWANDMIEHLNLELRRRALSDADSALAYLRKEFDVTPDVATREALSRLMEAQARSRMYANVTEEFAFKVVDRALPPDPDERLKPRRSMIVMMGIFLGLILGVGGALLVGPSIRSRGS